GRAPIITAFHPRSEWSRKQRDLLKPHDFREAEHEVHVLHRLPGGTLDQVVEGGADDGAAFDAVRYNADEGHVRAAHVAALRHLAEWEHVDERLGPIGLR